MNNSVNWTVGWAAKNNALAIAPRLAVHLIYPTVVAFYVNIVNSLHLWFTCLALMSVDYETMTRTTSLLTYFLTD